MSVLAVSLFVRRHLHGFFIFVCAFIYALIFESSHQQSFAQNGDYHFRKKEIPRRL